RRGGPTGEARAGRGARSRAPTWGRTAGRRTTASVAGSSTVYRAETDARVLLRFDPALGSRQLDGHVREGHSHWRAVRRTAMFRRKKERAGFLVALPARADELRLLLSATMVDEPLHPVVVPDVQVPGIARRVAALGRVFHRHLLRRALSGRQLLHALVLYIRTG